jgi:triacylglycerol lipase
MLAAALSRGQRLRAAIYSIGEVQPMEMPRLAHPIVLVHGVVGYGRMHVGGSTFMCYWTNIPEAIAAAGNRVFVPRLPPTAGIAVRAAALKSFIDRELPAEPVHLIAHSMGGLDSRYMIAHLGMAERVLSLTTLGTPHRGTAFADWGIRRLECLVKPVFDLLGLSREAFHDLTTTACRQFNTKTPDAANVRYFSVAGQFSLAWTLPEWQLSHRIIEKYEGPNDGLVSVASARWGEAFEVWDGDHASLVNRALTLSPLRPRWGDRIPAYARGLERLADAGF